jgi:hypothetical protein
MIMDTHTLHEVVAFLEATIQSDRDFLQSDDAEHLSFEEDFAIVSTICKLESIIQHFQDEIAKLQGK